MAIERLCGNCFWFDVKKTQRGKDYTICKVSEPRVDDQGITRWAAVQQNERGCGSWKAGSTLELERRHGGECCCSECLMDARRRRDPSKWQGLAPRMRADLKRLYPDFASDMERLEKESK